VGIDGLIDLTHAAGAKESDDAKAAEEDGSVSEALFSGKLEGVKVEDRFVEGRRLGVVVGEQILQLFFKLGVACTRLSHIPGALLGGYIEGAFVERLQPSPQFGGHGFLESSFFSQARAIFQSRFAVRSEI